MEETRGGEVGQGCGLVRERERLRRVGMGTGEWVVGWRRW